MARHYEDGSLPLLEGFCDRVFAQDGPAVLFFDTSLALQTSEREAARARLHGAFPETADMGFPEMASILGWTFSWDSQGFHRLSSAVPAGPWNGRSRDLARSVAYELLSAPKAAFARALLLSGPVEALGYGRGSDGEEAVEHGSMEWGRTARAPRELPSGRPRVGRSRAEWWGFVFRALSDAADERGMSIPPDAAALMDRDPASALPAALGQVTVDDDAAWLLSHIGPGCDGPLDEDERSAFWRAWAEYDRNRVSVAEAARAYGVTHACVCNRLREGKVMGVKEGAKEWRVFVKSLERSFGRPWPSDTG